MARVELAVSGGEAWGIAASLLLTGFLTLVAIGGANDAVFARFFARSVEAQYLTYRRHPSLVLGRKLTQEKHLRASRLKMLAGGGFGALVSGAWAVSAVLKAVQS